MQTLCKVNNNVSIIQGSEKFYCTFDILTRKYFEPNAAIIISKKYVYEYEIHEFAYLHNSH